MMGPKLPLNIAFLGCLYLALLMDQCERNLTPLTIDFLGGFYSTTTIIYRYERPKAPLTIAFVGGLYLTIIMARYVRTKFPLTIYMLGGF
jgi:hypothetical protein